MIGIFDSGYGGLSIFREIRHLLPQYDYVFLGDNARAPYGDRSFDEVYAFTRQAVARLFAMGCPLVILACNTASAKALRTIQQRDLPASADPTRRVLGVIRPTVERVTALTCSGHVGLIATRATVTSRSYDMELAKMATQQGRPIVLTSHACPRWVPLIEAGAQDSAAMREAVTTDLSALLEADPEVDTLILGCTHYPLVTPLIQRTCRELDHPEVIVMPQGHTVAYSLRDYLARHPEMEARISRAPAPEGGGQAVGHVCYFTTGDLATFDRQASLFMGQQRVRAEQMRL